MTQATRGLFVARLDIAQPHLSGVVKKVSAQIDAMQEALGPVDFWCLNGLAVECNGTVVSRQPAGFAARKRLHALRFYKTVLQSAATADYVYIRYQRCTPVFLRFLARLKAQAPDRPIFVELPTYPYDREYVTPRDRILGAVDRITRRGLARHVDRIVTFSAAPEIFGIPTVGTDNGVNLTDIPVCTPMAEPPLRLVGVANLGLRHAYDRVIDGLAAYRDAAMDTTLGTSTGTDTGRQRQVVFDIVGMGAHEPILRAHAARVGLLDKGVQFLGSLTGAALDAQMARGHIGISGLGMHRIGTDTSDIKSREYCARGLPFVIANADPDFGPDFTYAFHAPKDDTPLDIPAVLGFFDGLQASAIDYPQMMRHYAEANLTWRAKLAPVIAAIDAAIRKPQG